MCQKVPFWQFFRKDWNGHAVNPSQHLKIIFDWVLMNIQKDWNAKLEGAYSFMLKYSKIIVWRDGEWRHLRNENIGW